MSRVKVKGNRSSGSSEGIGQGEIGNLYEFCNILWFNAWFTDGMIITENSLGVPGEECGAGGNNMRVPQGHRCPHGFFMEARVTVK